MKRCVNCGYLETDDARFCSSCAGSSFAIETPAPSSPSGCEPMGASVYPVNCGAAAAPPATHAESAVRAISYTGFVILTFFMPFIGGYFLIRPNVPAGCRNFGIAWCTLMGIGCIATGTGADLVISVIAGILCILPVVIYAGRALYEKRKAKKCAERIEMERIEALLQMPLEKFSDCDLEELERKYEGCE